MRPARPTGARPRHGGPGRSRRREEQQPYVIAAATAAVRGSLILIPGGVFVRDTVGTLLGAVGVSGDTSDNDEAAAAAGIEGVGLQA